MKPGDEILVLRFYPVRIVHAWITGRRGVDLAGDTAHVYDYAVVRSLEAYARDGDVLASNEGITWARGWNTPEADAFRTSCALADRESPL